jgi:hypothetical protein
MSTFDTRIQRRVLHALAVESAKLGIAPDVRTVARASKTDLALARSVLIHAEACDLVRRDPLYGGRELTPAGVRWLAPEAFGGAEPIRPPVGARPRPEARKREAG